MFTKQMLRVALHEAGHAVVAYHFRYQVMLVDVRPALGIEVDGADYLGQVYQLPPWPSIDRPSYFVEDLRNEVDCTVAVAGYLAELIFDDEVTLTDLLGSSSDWSRVHAVIADWMTQGPRRIRREDAFRERIIRKAITILRANSIVVHGLALLVLDRGLVNGEELQRILRPIKRQRPGSIHRWHDVDNEYGYVVEEPT